MRDGRRSLVFVARACSRLLPVLVVLSAGTVPAGAQPLPATRLTNLSFDQRLGAQVDLGLSFKDEQGNGVKLGDFFNQKPVILDLGYYECPMLCSLVLNGLVQSMQGMQPSVGKDFEVVCVSISPTEGPALAAAKKKTYLMRYGRAGAVAGWHFLTGGERAIRALADQVGFHFAYDPSIGQYAHPSGIVILTPEGKVSRYFFGVAFPTTDLDAALRGAGAKRVSSPVKQLLILCFQHLPLIGKYSGSVMLGVRIGAVLVLALLAGGIGLMLRRGRKTARSRNAGEASPGAGGPGTLPGELKPEQPHPTSSVPTAGQEGKDP